MSGDLLLSAIWIGALLLLPVCAIYCALSLRRDIAGANKGMILLGIMAVAQPVIFIILLSWTLHEMVRTGTGL